MSHLTELDLIQIISGADEDGRSKCSLGLKLQRQNAEGELRDIEDEFVSTKPIIQISKQVGGFVLVDLVFDSVEDRDLNIIFSYLKRFFAASESAADDETDFAVITFTIVPEAYEGRYFVMGLNPIFYALTPDDALGEPKIIRLAFVCQDDLDMLPNFLFLKSSDEQLKTIMIDENDNIE